MVATSPMETPPSRERTAAGALTLGMGAVGLPIAALAYAGLAAASVIGFTACVDGESLMCLGGPLIIGPGFALAAALALVVAAAFLGSLLVSGAALVQSRPFYVGAALGMGAVLGAAGLFFAYRAHASLATFDLESAVSGQLFVDVAVAAPLWVSAIGLTIAAGVRGLSGVVMDATRAPRS
jgi:hypothetical protein